MATQGPLESTITDFWKMVCQVKSRAIVMLCNLQERGEVRREKERERESIIHCILNEALMCMRNRFKASIHKL